jgi:Tfp pilus assembly protein PilF
MKMNDQKSESQKNVAQAMGIQEAALLQTGFRFYQQGRLVEAKSIFEGLAVLDFNNAYVHGILGSIYQKAGDDDAAISSYTAAIRLFDKDVSSLVNRGELFLKAGKFQEAAEDFAKAIQLDPTRKNAASNRARLLVAVTQDALTLSKEKGIEAFAEERNRAQQTQGRR